MRVKELVYELNEVSVMYIAKKLEGRATKNKTWQRTVMLMPCLWSSFFEPEGKGRCRQTASGTF